MSNNSDAFTLSQICSIQGIYIPADAQFGLNLNHFKKNLDYFIRFLPTFVDMLRENIDKGRYHNVTLGINHMEDITHSIYAVDAVGAGDHLIGAMVDANPHIIKSALEEYISTLSSLATEIQRLNDQKERGSEFCLVTAITQLQAALESFEKEKALQILKIIPMANMDKNIILQINDIHRGIIDFNYEMSSKVCSELLAVLTQAQTPQRKDKPKILVVDDESHVLNMVSSVLEQRFQVYAMSCPCMALKFLYTQTPDLVILDIDMPRIDGFTLVYRIRELARLEKTPFVFLTSNARQEDVLEALKLGCKDFIIKPVNPVNLVTRIENILNL